MNYQGVNGNGQVVIASATEEEMTSMKSNPAYNFVRWEPIVTPSRAVEAPAEVADAEKPQTDGDSTRARSSRKTDGKKSR